MADLKAREHLDVRPIGKQSSFLLNNPGFSHDAQINLDDSYSMRNTASLIQGGYNNG
jgi:hypothetical protein